MVRHLDEELVLKGCWGFERGRGVLLMTSLVESHSTRFFSQDTNMNDTDMQKLVYFAQLSICLERHWSFAILQTYQRLGSRVSWPHLPPRRAARLTIRGCDMSSCRDFPGTSRRRSLRRELPLSHY